MMYVLTTQTKMLLFIWYIDTTQFEVTNTALTCPWGPRNNSPTRLAGCVVLSKVASLSLCHDVSARASFFYITSDPLRWSPHTGSSTNVSSKRNMLIETWRPVQRASTPPKFYSSYCFINPATTAAKTVTWLKFRECRFLPTHHFVTQWRCWIDTPVLVPLAIRPWRCMGEWKVCLPPYYPRYQWVVYYLFTYLLTCSLFQDDFFRN
jgi:hypothetical protein